MIAVESDQWRARAQQLREEGFSLFDLLAGVDRESARELVLRVVDPRTDEDRMLITTVVERVDSLAGIWPGAAWAEREIAEMLGVGFDGHPDPRALLLRDAPEAPPLLKSTPLPERLARPWPGEAGTQERRRRRPQLPPGVRDEWVRGVDAS